MKQKLQDMKCNIKDIKKYIVPVIVALVIAMLEVLGEMLDLLQQRSDGVAGIAVGTKQIVGFGIKAFLLWVIIFIVLILGWKYGKRAYCGKTSVCPVFRKKLYVWLAIVISWIPCFIAYFPGIYSYDGEPQLLQYTSGNFDNHHPVFHTLILGGCYDLGQWLQAKGIMIDGIAFYSIIQMAVLGFALASVVMLLTRRGAGRVIQWITMAMFCLFPATPIIAISTTKDTLFTAVFVMVVVKCLEMLETKILTKKIAIEICVYAVLCMLFRRNASYVALLMLLVLAIVYLVNAIRYKKWTWNTLTGCIAICFVSILLFNIAEKSIMAATSAIQGESAEALSVPLMQMARAYKSNQEDATVKYGEELYEYISPLGLSNYRPLISDGVKQGFNNELFGKEKTDFVKIYLKMFKSYPGSYIQAFLYMTKGDWQLMDNTHCEVYKDWWRNRTGYLITDATEVFALGFVKKSNLLPVVRDAYESIVTECDYRSFVPLQIIFAPATYVFVVLIGGIVLIMGKKRDRFMVWLIVGLYLLTIIAGPCVLVRYIFPLMMLSPVIVAMMWDE